MNMGLFLEISLPPYLTLCTFGVCVGGCGCASVSSASVIWWCVDDGVLNLELVEDAEASP